MLNEPTPQTIWTAEVIIRLCLRDLKYESLHDKAIDLSACQNPDFRETLYFEQELDGYCLPGKAAL